MQNINLLFNKLYYENMSIKKVKNEDILVLDKIKEKKKNLILSKFYQEDYQPCELQNVKKLRFKTLYPGLLVGTGYAHGVSCEDDAKLGFSFDYVTGQPYIPGSSVKGILRNVFSDDASINMILKDECQKTFDKETLSRIITEIFDGGDVFLDAVILCGNEEGYVLGADYITPHENPVKPPIPLQMFKIIPGVTIEFRFILKNGKLSEDEKLNVFKKIIEDFGVGAKTNVGYGCLEYVDPDKSEIRYPINTISSNEKNRKSEKSGVRHVCVKCGEPTMQKRGTSNQYFRYCKKCNDEYKKTRKK